MQQQTFQLADILSVSTGILMGTVGGLYEVLDFMEGYSHFTAELGEAAQRVAPSLREQLPFLHEIAKSDLEGKVTPDNYQEIMATYVVKYGASHTLTALGTEGRAESVMAMHERIVGKEKIIPIDASAESWLHNADDTLLEEYITLYKEIMERGWQVLLHRIYSESLMTDVWALDFGDWQFTLSDKLDVSLDMLRGMHLPGDN